MQNKKQQAEVTCHTGDMASSAAQKALSPRGRPKGQRSLELNDLIIKAASDLMLKNGFDETSMDAIAATAGVTKRTIYTRFGSKEGLLARVLMNASTPIYEYLHSKNLDPSMSLHQQLVSMAVVVNTILMKPQTQKWLLFSVNGVARRPELNDLISKGFVDYYAYVEKMLRTAFDAHSIKVENMSVNTRIFMSLIASPAQKMAFYAVHPGTKQEQHQFISDAVKIFLNGCAINNQSNLID